MDAPNREFALAGSLEELKAKGRLVVHGGHRPILVTRFILKPDYRDLDSHTILFNRPG